MELPTFGRRELYRGTEHGSVNPIQSLGDSGINEESTITCTYIELFQAEPITLLFRLRYLKGFHRHQSLLPVAFSTLLILGLWTALG